MNKTLKFWLLFIAFTLTALIIPLAFIIWRFELFQKVTKTTFGVWGVLCLIIVFAFGIVVSKYLTKGAPYSYGTQIINGVIKVVIPCFIVWFIAYKLKDEMELFIQVMGVVTVSETIAVIVNPLPNWIRENKKNEAEDIFDVVLNKRDEKAKKL